MKKVNADTDRNTATFPYKKTGIAIAVATATGLLLGAHLYNPVLATQASNDALNTTNQFQLPGSFADLVESVKPAVVNISISGTAKGFEKNMPQFRFPEGSEMDEFFKRFFDQMPRKGERGGRKMQSLGSGFIVDAEGHVVTNNHVVNNADEITVILDDGTELDAKLVGTDKKTDLALLKVESDKDLPYVTFGNSERSRVGDWVIAIGNPFGLGGTTTTGIISARGRDINSGPLDDFIQVDAPINRGNSGGPLFNTKGDVIGVNTAIFSPNGGNVGIGFAIPAEIAQSVITQLKETGMVQRGWLGVHIQTVSEEIADSLDMDRAEGALVTQVVSDSPAEEAGLEAGDVILNFDGEPVGKLKDLPRLVANTPGNTKVTIDVWRDGKEKTLRTTIAASEENAKVLSKADEEEKSEAKLGLALAPLTDEHRNRYRIDEEVSGVIIVDVEQDSPAADKGIRRGDIILRVGDEDVSSPDDVIENVKRAKKENGKAVLILIHRDGQERFVALRFA